MSIALGGEVTRIQTYGELVTSIINPSHRLAEGYPVDTVSVDGKSRMRNYNDVMTVTELTDLVMFLQVLTGETARDRPMGRPNTVPSGLPVD